MKYQDVIASELVSPHSEDYSNHLFVENQMTDPSRNAAVSYSQSRYNPVVNAAFFGGTVSQPRWIRFWRLRNRGCMANFNPRSLETQHAHPILPSIESPTSTHNSNDVKFLVTDLTRQIYLSQYYFVTRKWCEHLPTHMHYSDNAYIVSLYSRIASPLTTKETLQFYINGQ